MTSPDLIPTTLRDQLRQLGLVYTATDLDDFIAGVTQKRWSPVVQLERLVQAELEARLRQRVRRLRDTRLGRFKPMVDWEWEWPKAIHRPTVERVLTLDFLEPRERHRRGAARPRQDDDRQEPRPSSDSRPTPPASSPI